VVEEVEEVEEEVEEEEEVQPTPKKNTNNKHTANNNVKQNQQVVHNQKSNMKSNTTSNNNLSNTVKSSSTTTKNNMSPNKTTSQSNNKTTTTAGTKNVNNNDRPIKTNTKQNKMVIVEDDMMGDMAGVQEKWRTMIEEPDYAANLTDDILLAPKVNLELEYVFGYRTRDTRNNLKYINTDSIVYHGSCLNIIHNLKSNTQSHLFGHNDDIISFAMDGKKKLIASGELSTKPDSKPSLIVWSTQGKLIQRFDGIFDKGINALSFNPTGTKLVAIGMDDNHTIYLFDLTENKLVASEKGDSYRILDVCFKSEREFVTVGIKHYKYWVIDNNKLVAKDGIFGETDNKLGLVKNSNENFVTGSATGEVTLWKDEKIIMSKKGHSKNVDCIFTNEN
jgi:hypothetical protein